VFEFRPFRPARIRASSRASLSLTAPLPIITRIRGCGDAGEQGGTCVVEFKPQLQLQPSTNQNNNFGTGTCSTSCHVILTAPMRSSRSCPPGLLSCYSPQRGGMKPWERAGAAHRMDPKPTHHRIWDMRGNRMGVCVTLASRN